MRLTASIVIALAAASAIAQNPEPPPRAPPDISEVVTPRQLKALDEAMKPYVEQARNTFPGARARFLAGLGKGQSLFVTARIYDERTRSELACILVTGIREDIVEGTIWSKPHLVTTHGFRDPYAFPESQLIDWLIAYPDGTEEGNVVGKFMKVPK